MVCMQGFKGQNRILPSSIRDMISEDHVCFLVEGFVGNLDFSNFDMIYDGAGYSAYHPRIIIRILVCGLLCRVRSSRRLARSCRENFVFMFLAEKVNPDFRLIARFRADNDEFVKDSFRKTVELASENKLVDLSFISIGSSTLKAYLGSRRYFGRK